MKLNLLHKSSLLLVLILVLGFLPATMEVAKAQGAYDKPALPRLSLSGNDQWDDQWYPDGRIWLPAAANGPREFLLPVFVTNRWHTYPQTDDVYIPPPINSFRFTIMYNSGAIRPVSIETSWPLKDEKLGYLPLANKFQLSWYDDKDWSYGSYMEATPPFDLYSKGRGMTITGISSDALPNTDLYSEEWKVMLYIRFRIVPEDGQPVGNSQFSPIYIKNDSIIWNGLNVQTDAPFKSLRPEYKGRVVSDDYADPVPIITANGAISYWHNGIGGVDNSIATNIWNGGWRMLPGTIYLRISDNVPQFGWLMQRGIGTIPPVNELAPELWDIADPITVDSNSQTPLFGSRVIQIYNRVSSSRILDVTVESDQPWLQFRTLAGATYKNAIPQPTTKGYINWIDNGILGDAARGTPLPNIQTATDGEIQLEIRCNPLELQNSPSLPSPEMTGMHVGYITFRSSTALVNPVRLRVSFLYFRIPLESNPNLQGLQPNGINLSIFNSKKPSGDSVRLIFGTGHRATDGVDSLFGEYAYEYGMKSFEARWFPPKNSKLDTIYYATLFSNGFGDFAPDDDNNDKTPKRSNSRDIRSNFDTLTSITYYCKIKEDDANDYPLILEWDTGDFPDGAQLFLKDNVNGFLFPDVDMRNATSIGGTRRSFTIQDARVKEFVIEYTLPRVIDYVDENGAPIIKKGWNLLSLPVRPINKTWNVVYPNAINRPYYFSLNQYQDDPQLRVGVGYFIKYGDKIDTKFAGTFINTVTNENASILDPIVIYPGWNTIGCVSSVLNVQDIDFTQKELQIPSKVLVRAAGIWGYKTDRGYEEVSEIRPGLGYWLRSDANGYLKLIAKSPKATLNDFVSPRQTAYDQSVKLSISDNAQNQGKVYFGSASNSGISFELPPAPPFDLFDVRFNQGTILSTENQSVVRMQGISYPVMLSIDKADVTYKFYDAATNEYIGTIEKGSTGNVTVNGGSGAIRVSKSNDSYDFSITNYPNPVTSATTVSYSIPEDGQVSVTLFDALGNEVSTLVNGFVKAGSYPVSLDASTLVSGQYILKLVAGNNSAVRTVTVIK